MPLLLVKEKMPDRDTIYIVLRNYQKEEYMIMVMTDIMVLDNGEKFWTREEGKRMFEMEKTDYYIPFREGCEALLSLR